MQSKPVTLLFALLCCTAAGTALADWLVLDSSSPRFPRYLLLEQGARIELADGERLQLLDDAGATHDLRGPGTTRLADLQAGGQEAATSEDGLLDRLATLMAAPGKSATPGTSRSPVAGPERLPATAPLAGAWPGAAARPPAATVRIDASERRCVASLAGLVLERDATAARLPARVAIVLPGGQRPRDLDWPAGQTTLTLDRAGAAATRGGDTVIRITPAGGPPRELRLRLIPATAPAAERLGRMTDAGCRDDLARLLDAMTKP
jgi:hypothetical protein